MIFHEQPTDPWVPFDFKLLEAYQILQDETCPKCGHPIWLCRSTSQGIQFKVKSDVCYAEKALEEHRVSQMKSKDRAEAKKNKAEWGRFFFTQPYNPPNVDAALPTRTEYYETLAAKMD